MSNEEQSLLEAFVVNNEDWDELEAHLAQFNIFEALGVARQELRHSDFLAFLMDPSQNHDLGDAFLQRFLKRALMGADLGISAVEIDVADLNGAVVERERWHIDILVHDENNRLVCAVENKIGSGEHSSQLRRYHDIIQKEYPSSHYRHVFIYLTPEGDLPSEDVYIPFSYGAIAELVDYVRGVYSTRLGPSVQSLMEHYTVMLRRHVVSDSKIVELCQKIYREHKQALDLIYEHRPDLQEGLKDILVQLIRGAAALDLDESVKAYIRFSVKDWDRFPFQRAGEGWTDSKRILLFVFANRVNKLSLGLYIGPGPESIRQPIQEFASKHPGEFRGKPRNVPPHWIRIYEKVFLKEMDYEDFDPDGLEDKLKKTWEEFLKKDLPVLCSAVAGIDWPVATNSSKA